MAKRGRPTRTQAVINKLTQSNPTAPQSLDFGVGGDKYRMPNLSGVQGKINRGEIAVPTPTIAHAATTGQTTDDHHAEDHAARHASIGADPVDHDTLTNWVANKHIDWTNATQNFLTTGSASVGSLQFPTSGGYANPVATGLVIAGGDTAGDFIQWSASTVDAESITLTGGAGGVYTTSVTTTYGFRNIYNSLTTGQGTLTECNALTTGTGYDLLCPIGTTGSGYKITLMPTIAAGFKAVHVVSDDGFVQQDVHTVDEQGLISNWDATGISRWKRRTWKGCTEMDTLMQTPITQVMPPVAPVHFKSIFYDHEGVFWSVQIPHDWDGVSDLNITVRFLIDQVGGVTPVDQFAWNCTMWGGQPFDNAANIGQLQFGFYLFNPNIAQWDIHEVSFPYQYAVAPILQAGDTVWFHFYGTQFGEPERVGSVGILGAWVEYQSIHPELPQGTT